MFMITQITKTDYTDWVRTTALIFMQCLLLWSTASASLVGKSFNLPSQYGIVKESFEATDTTQNTNRMIIHKFYIGN